MIAEYITMFFWVTILFHLSIFQGIIIFVLIQIQETCRIRCGVITTIEYWEHHLEKFLNKKNVLDLNKMYVGSVYCTFKIIGILTNSTPYLFVNIHT